MASRGSVKSFYRQKKSGGITKSNSKPSPSTKKSSATIGAALAQSPALVSHGSPHLKDDYGESEQLLREFDMNMAYGPCIGMSRLSRWERADKLGLNPPEEVGVVLGKGKVGLQCLWDGRV
ncbi:hypothetical protein Syun_017959 [Stephania yunnanensis]|uniref:DNA polymerase delta subunit 4 n=1 Tax=Stephania yunnanensis TaxID=152371 RepID=A0AAP0IRE8_9MAGN